MCSDEYLWPGTNDAAARGPSDDRDRRRPASRGRRRPRCASCPTATRFVHRRPRDETRARSPAPRSRALPFASRSASALLRVAECRGREPPATRQPTAVDSSGTQCPRYSTASRLPGLRDTTQDLERQSASSPRHVLTIARASSPPYSAPAPSAPIRSSVPPSAGTANRSPAAAHARPDIACPGEWRSRPSRSVQISLLRLSETTSHLIHCC